MKQLIPPFISKKYKIIDNGFFMHGKVHVNSVNDLSEQEIEEIESIINNKIKLAPKITEETFKKRFSEKYNEVSMEEITPSKFTPNEKFVDFSTEELYNEIKIRSLRQKSEAIINITQDGKVSFTNLKINWPVGQFKVEITAVDEIRSETKETK